MSADFFPLRSLSPRQVCLRQCRPRWQTQPVPEQRLGHAAVGLRPRKRGRPACPCIGFHSPCDSMLAAANAGRSASRSAPNACGSTGMRRLVQKKKKRGDPLVHRAAACAAGSVSPETLTRSRYRAPVGGAFFHFMLRVCCEKDPWGTVAFARRAPGPLRSAIAQDRAAIMRGPRPQR
jgi:hypothetical protein